MSAATLPLIVACSLAALWPLLRARRPDLIPRV
jgi:hypothetical protein